MTIRFFVGTGLALFAVLFVVTHCAGCANLIPFADDPELASLNAKLSLCRKVARDAKDAGSSSSSAYMKYEDCKRREGVEGAGAQ